MTDFDKLTPLQAEVLQVLLDETCERVDSTSPAYVYGSPLTEMSDERCREILGHWEQKRERQNQEVTRMRLRMGGRWGNVLANAMDDD